MDGWVSGSPGGKERGSKVEGQRDSRGARGVAGVGGAGEGRDGGKVIGNEWKEENTSK